MSSDFDQNKPKICDRNTGDIFKRHIILLLISSDAWGNFVVVLFVPSLAFNVAFQPCMVKLMRSAVWYDAAAELKSLDRKAWLVFLSASLCAAVFCADVKEVLVRYYSKKIHKTCRLQFSACSINTPSLQRLQISQHCLVRVPGTVSPQTRWYWRCASKDVCG